MRIFLSALLVVLISMAVVPFTSGAYAPDPPQAPVSQNVYLIQTTSDKEGTPPSQPTVPLDQYLSQLKQDIKDYASLNTAIVTYGITGLGVITAILALGAGGVAYFTTRADRAALREKKILFDKYVAEIKEKKILLEKYGAEINLLVEQGKEHLQYFRNLISQTGPTEAFSENVIKEALEKIRTGTGSEVLWGKAILAQEDKQWDKAYTYWTSILEDEPKNDSALFGAALACGELFERQNKDPAFLPLLQEGLQYIERISYAQTSAPVLNRWGTLIHGQIYATTDLALRTELKEQAIDKYRKAIACDPKNSKAWMNWGSLLFEEANAETDPARKAELQRQANDYYRKATECDPKNAEAWMNWGNLLSEESNAEADPERKVELQGQATDNYRKATECDPNNSLAWYNWGIWLVEQAEVASDPARKAELQRQANDYCRKATECDPKNSPAWNNWGVLLCNQADVASDPVYQAVMYDQACDKFRTATECHPTHSKAWKNWGDVLAIQAKAVSDLARKAELLEQTANKYRTATECDPKYSTAWNNWGKLLRVQADAEKDPARKAELQKEAQDKFRRAKECSNSEE